jgi:hypothetical protein
MSCSIPLVMFPQFECWCRTPDLCRATKMEGIIVNRMWLILTSIVTMVSISLAEGRKLSPDLETQKNNSGFVDVIVQYRTKPGAAHRRHLARRGGQIMTDLPFIKALHVSMPTSQVAKLAKDAEVAYVSVNRPIRTRLNNSAGAVLAQLRGAWDSTEKE